MKTLSKTHIIALAASLLIPCSLLRADDAKDYQVTGPVLELTDTKIVVMKGKDKWEVARNAQTKVDGELKLGAKVTIHYSMTATDVKVAADKAEKKAEKKPAAEKKK